MSVEECAQLKKVLGHRKQVTCLTDGEKITVSLNLEGLKLEEALELLGEVRSKVRKQAGKPVRVHTTGTVEL